MNLSLRPTIASDYSAMTTWIPDATACLRWAGPRVSFPFSTSELSTLLAVPGGGEFSYSLIDECGTPKGFGQHWVLKLGAVHLGRILVAPHSREHGLGRILCQQLISAALHKTQANAVTLRVYKDNLIAVRLYTSLGFGIITEESTDDVFFMKMPAL
jgi:[ribosomal protein S18]-alanine N-acetyltransferase